MINKYISLLADGVGIKIFNIRVKEAYSKTLDDKLWIPFVWDTVYYLMREQNDGGTSREDQNAENWNLLVAATSMIITYNIIIDRCRNSKAITLEDQ